MEQILCTMPRITRSAESLHCRRSGSAALSAKHTHAIYLDQRELRHILCKKPHKGLAPVTVAVTVALTAFVVAVTAALVLAHYVGPNGYGMMMYSHCPDTEHA